MAAAHVQFLGGVSVSGTNHTATVLSPASKTVTVGNIILVGWHSYYDVTPTGVTDNLGNTYTRVERKTRFQATDDLWYAPVTAGGSITTITVAHPTAKWNLMVASEFSGVGTLSVAGEGLTGTGTTITWVNNKTIPANGLAVGIAGKNKADAHTAGAASGTPSTSIAKSGEIIDTPNAYGLSLCYALAGSSSVTTFVGTTTTTVTESFAGAGGLFNAVAASGPASLKTVNGLAVASVKTLRSGLLIASGKTWNGVA